MRKVRCLVTGAYGFIGSHFIKMALKNTDWSLIGFNRSSNQAEKFRLEEGASLKGLTMIHGDLCDASAMSGLCEGIDYVVHFAAKTFVDHSIVDPMPFVQSNIVGTYNLLEQARKYHVKRLIQVSTDEVYGAILDGAYREDARLNPTNPYSASKAAADMLALSYHNTYELPVIVTRTENNYGPWQHRQKVLPTFVRKALAGDPLPVYGDGKHRRMWLHVNDHCDAILTLLAIGTPGEIYHVAGAQELENIELAKMILRILGLPETQYELIEDHNIRPGHDRRYALDTAKLRALGWSPRVGLEEGMKETVEWYKSNAWWTE